MCPNGHLVLWGPSGSLAHPACAGPSSATGSWAVPLWCLMASADRGAMPSPVSATTLFSPPLPLVHRLSWHFSQGMVDGAQPPPAFCWVFCPPGHPEEPRCSLCSAQGPRTPKPGEPRTPVSSSLLPRLGKSFHCAPCKRLKGLWFPFRTRLERSHQNKCQEK